MLNTLNKSKGVFELALGNLGPLYDVVSLGRTPECEFVYLCEIW